MKESIQMEVYTVDRQSVEWNNPGHEMNLNLWMQVIWVEHVNA